MLHFRCYPSRYKFKIMAKMMLVCSDGEKCMRCDSRENIEVDHIKPESLYPELALDYENTQLLCRSCNASKGNRHEKSYIESSRKRYKEEFFAGLLRDLEEQKNEQYTYNDNNK